MCCDETADRATQVAVSHGVRARAACVFRLLRWGQTARLGELGVANGIDHHENWLRIPYVSTFWRSHYNAIDHHKNWLRFPYDPTFWRSHYLHPHPYEWCSQVTRADGGGVRGGAAARNHISVAQLPCPRPLAAIGLVVEEHAVLVAGALEPLVERPHLVKVEPWAPRRTQLRELGKASEPASDTIPIAIIATITVTIALLMTVVMMMTMVVIITTMVRVRVKRM
jgi:hypothetical protein